MAMTVFAVFATSLGPFIYLVKIPCFCFKNFEFRGSFLSYFQDYFHFNEACVIPIGLLISGHYTISWIRCSVFLVSSQYLTKDKCVIKSIMSINDIVTF